jgi:hypothetical protein
MKPLLNISKEQIPTFQEIACFPKKSSFFLACFWLSFPILLGLMLLSSLIGLAFGTPLPMSDWVPPLVILLILLPFTVPNFLIEKRHHRENKNGIHKIGFFFSKDALLLCTTEDIYQFIPHGALATVEVGYYISSSGTGPRIAGWMKLTGPELSLRVEDLYDYDSIKLIQFLRTWKSDLVFQIDSSLSDYNKYFPEED